MDLPTLFPLMLLGRCFSSSNTPPTFLLSQIDIFGFWVFCIYLHLSKYTSQTSMSILPFLWFRVWPPLYGWPTRSSWHNLLQVDSEWWAWGRISKKVGNKWSNWLWHQSNSTTSQESENKFFAWITLISRLSINLLFTSVLWNRLEEQNFCLKTVEEFWIWKFLPPSRP